jgi:hypothetical protein
MPALSHPLWKMTLETIRSDHQRSLSERDLAGFALDLLEAGRDDPGIQEYLTQRARRAA